MEQKAKETAEYLITLLKSVLDGANPPEKPDDIDFDQLYRLAKFHHVQCMTYYAIEKMKVQPEPVRNRKWKSERDQHIVKSMVQLSERDTVIDALTGAEIDILPLKGCLLKEMYPQDDYREMADLDILIDVRKAELARTQMESLGYTTKYFDASHHDNYEKPPYMGVELHRNMFSEQVAAHSYYDNVWEKAIPDESKAHCFHFSWNDYYMFMLLHFAKHYFNGGSGIRSIMDIAVFLKRHKDDLNQEYLRRDLDLLGLYEFKETAESLADCWFGNGKATDITEEMAEYVITSGVYGTHNRNIQNQIKRAEHNANSVWMGRVYYFFSRTFPPYKTMCIIYGFLKKAPALLPICWVLRLIRALVKSKEQVKFELDALKSRE